MSCRRRMVGSGYVKPENPALEVENNCALAALMAAREAQDAAFNKAWTSEEEEKEKSEVLDVSEAPVITATEQTLHPPASTGVRLQPPASTGVRLQPPASTGVRLQPPVASVPPSDTCFQVDGHFYKVPDAERIGTIEAALIALAAERAKEEATWQAHWTSAPETKTDTNTMGDIPQLEVSEL